MREQTSDPSIPTEATPAGGAPGVAARVAVIDVLRGLAILWVMSFHLWLDETGGAILVGAVYEQFFDQVQARNAWGSLASAFEVFLGSGYQGVQVFMMLSGVSLVLNAFRRGEPRALVGYRARFGKLLPAYWAGIGIFVAVYTLIALLQIWRDGGGFHEGWWAITIAHGVPYAYEIVDVVWALSVVGPTFRGEVTLPVGALWFVPLLLQYYLLFPLLLPLLRRVGPSWFAAFGIAVTIVARTWLLQFGDALIGIEYHRLLLDQLAVFRLAEFTFGMSLGYLFARHRETAAAWVTSPLDVLGLLVLAVLLQWAALGVSWDNVAVRSVMVTVGFAGLALLIAPLLFKPPGLLEVSAPGRALIYLGVISLTALIVNDCMRMVASFIATGDPPRAAWWFFLTVVYIPAATVLLAYPLALALRLLPEQRRSATREPPPSLDLQPAPGGGT
jgi:peptidoglycan/LPS O-acetylase OafA/YrhL